MTGREIPNRAMVPASGPTAPVPKDPQPSVDRIDELARRVITGDILLPKFQRGFVWERPQILELLDSIARNYPIGSILLWQSRRELRSENRIGGLEIELPRPDYPVNYLLDGQQRLSAICGALYWEGSSPQSPWNIVYDLRSKEFIHLTTLDDPPLHQIRMNKLRDPALFFKHVSSLDTLNAPDKDALKAHAESLFNRFKDYKIATVTLGDMPIEDVAPIFERINSTGTQLTIVDLMRAATWSEDFDLIDAIEDILEILSNKGFGGLDKKVLLRGMSAAAGGGFSTTSINELRKHSAADLKNAAKATEEAAKRATDFLTTQIIIPGDGVIPYGNQFVLLTEIFRLLPAPSASQYEEIRKWFWRTAVSGYFSGWNTGMMSSDQRAVQRFASTQSPTIQIDVTKPVSAIWNNRVFRSNNAHSKVLAIVLSYYAPVDLLTGQRIDVTKALAWTNNPEFHHFFPRDYLATKGVDSDHINRLANIIYLTSASNKTIANRAPSDYLKDVKLVAGSSLPAWLETLLIPTNAFEAALNDDYEQFCRLRAEHIHNTVMKLAGWSL